MRSKIEPMTFTERARRRQIVAAAVEVLATSGYSSASLSAIAERAGVSKGVISYYFAGKDALLREVVSSVLVEAGDYMRPRVAAVESSTEALRVYLRSNLAFIDTHRREILALIEVVNGTPLKPGTTPPYGPGHRAAVDALTELLVEGQRNGEFGDFSARLVAVALRASIDAVSELLRDDPSMDVTAYEAELERLFIKGVSK